MLVSELFIYILIGCSCFTVSMISFIYSLRWICGEALIGFGASVPHQYVSAGGEGLTEACAGSDAIDVGTRDNTFKNFRSDTCERYRL